MMTATLLIVLGTLLRFAQLPWNGVPMMALALYAGARLPRRWAVIVPLAAMIASDAVIDWGTGRSIFALDRLAVYFCLVMTSLAGGWLKTSNSPMARLGMAFGSSMAFFLITNFAVWAMHEFNMYPLTLAGLAECYVAAIPFHRNTLIAELVGTAVIFSLDGLAHRVASRFATKPALSTQ